MEREVPGAAGEAIPVNEVGWRVLPEGSLEKIAPINGSFFCWIGGNGGVRWEWVDWWGGKTRVTELVLKREGDEV